ncbi:UNVERIFIED_CONTAM: hypothetical protein K2H54_060556 [Gekko kuhli]
MQEREAGAPAAWMGLAWRWRHARAAQCTFLLGLNLLATKKRREKEHQAGGDWADGKDGLAATQEQLLPPPDKDKGQ